MRGPVRQTLWLALVVLTFVVAPVGRGSDGPIAFVDQHPLTREFAALQKSGGLQVKLRNTSEARQTITVRVIDLEGESGEGDRAVSTLFASTMVEIEPGHERDVLVPTRTSDTKPAPGSYSGIVVAGAERGDIARRDLTITVAESSQPEQGERLAADGLPDVTLRATNFIPSILSPLGPFLFAVGFVILLLLFVFWGSLSALRWLVCAGGVSLGIAGYTLDAFGSNPWSSPRNVAIAQLALLVVGGVLIVCGLFAGSGWWNPALVALGCGLLIAAAVVDTHGQPLNGRPSPALIDAKSLPVAPGQSSGTVGVAVTDESDISELRATTKSGATDLTAEGLDRAGAYTGKVDLRKGADGGDAKATINVHDWWPWALLTIALGVGLGYLMRWFFDRRRPRLLRQSDANQVWQRISQADSDWQHTANGEPFVTYGWIRLAQDWRSKIDTLLEQAKPDDASKEIQALQSYQQSYEALRSMLGPLGDAARDFESLWRAHEFGIHTRTDVAPLRLVDELLEAGPSLLASSQVDNAVKTLEEHMKKLKAAEDLIHEARWLFSAVINLKSSAESLKQTHPAKAAELDKIIAALPNVAREILRASESEALASARRGLNSQEDAFEKIVRPAENEPPIEEAVLDALPAGSVIDVQGIRRFRVYRNVPRASRPTGNITCRRSSSREAEDVCSGDLDDLFEFTVRISDPESHRSSLTISWDFGDGSDELAQIVALKNGSGVASARHQFTTGGRRKVRVRAEGRALAWQDVQLTTVGTAARTRAQFELLDREMTLLAGLLAVGSGMLALYFANASWGQPKDYLQALLWGAVVAEGVKLVGALVSRVWSSG